MKVKISTILLLFSFMSPLVMTYVLVNLQLQKLKFHEGWRQVAGKHREELLLLKFSKAEQEHLLDWKNPMEFQYEGEMYDIVETEQHGDTTHYWVWWDREETELLKDLYRVISINENNSKINYIISNLYFRSLFFNDYATETSKPLFRLVRYSPNRTPLYKSVDYTPPSPPPKMIEYTTGKSLFLL